MIPTLSVKLTSSQHKAMMELHRYNFHLISKLPISACNEISGLERQLSEVIRAVGGVAYLKSGRKSCMDYATKLDNKNTKRLLESFSTLAKSELRSCSASKYLISDTTLILWCQAVTRSLLVTTGFDAVQTLASSALASWALSLEVGSTLYVRQFVSIDPCLEFRIYVYQNMLTGITQKRALFSPWLHKYASLVFEKIEKFTITQLIPKLADHPTFCADIVIFPEMKKEESGHEFTYKAYNSLYKFIEKPNFEIKLSQLIPFYPRAVIGFFEWGTHQRILKEGPMEVKYKTSPTTPVAGPNLQFERGAPFVAKNWLEVIQENVKWDHKVELQSKLLMGGITTIFVVVIAWLAYFAFSR